MNNQWHTPQLTLPYVLKLDDYQEINPYLYLGLPISSVDAYGFSPRSGKIFSPRHHGLILKTTNYAKSLITSEGRPPQIRILFRYYSELEVRTTDFPTEVNPSSDEYESSIETSKR